MKKKTETEIERERKKLRKQTSLVWDQSVSQATIEPHGSSYGLITIRQSVSPSCLGFLRADGFACSSHSKVDHTTQQSFRPVCS